MYGLELQDAEQKPITGIDNHWHQLALPDHDCLVALKASKKDDEEPWLERLVGARVDPKLDRKHPAHVQLLLYKEVYTEVQDKDYFRAQDVKRHAEKEAAKEVNRVAWEKFDKEKKEKEEAEEAAKQKAGAAGSTGATGGAN